MRSHGSYMIRVLVVSLLVMSVPLAAGARSSQRCKIGALTEDMLKDYSVIIAGKVVERESSDEMSSGFALTSWGKNIVHVVKSWKGPDKGERIAIHRNERWGDGFSTGSNYLIFAGHDDADEPESPLIAPVCSHTKALSEAGRIVKGLEKYFSHQSQKGVKLEPDSKQTQ